MWLQRFREIINLESETKKNQEPNQRVGTRPTKFHNIETIS